MKITVFLPTAAAIILLMGCEGMPLTDRIAMLRDETTVVTLRVGANKAGVLAAMGQPESRIPIHDGAGECFNYTRVLRGTPYPFYVGFNKLDQVINSGYDRNCTQAKAQGLVDHLVPTHTE